MTIVCGTDFSAVAEGATKIAARIADRLGEPLVLLHVLDELGAELTVGSDRDSVFEPERQRMSAVADVARTLGASVETDVVAGDPARVIASQAAARGATLVVVGHVGRRGRGRWLVGDVAESVAQRCGPPALVVRASAGLEAWLRRERALEIVLGVDRTETSRGTARWLRTLGKIGPMNVIAAHVAPPSEDVAALEQSLARDLDDDLAELRANGRVTFEVRAADDKNIDETLVGIAETKAADLVVVGSHHRSAIERVWRRSISRGVLHLAPVSVLVVSTFAAHDEERAPPVIRDVLVATDLSALGDAAVPHALSLLPDGGTLHLVHVLSTALGKTPITSLAPMRPPVRDEGAFAEVRAALARLVPRDAKARGVQVHVHVLEGEVADELCAAADRLAVDALCMASRGRSRTTAAVLGSSTQNVLAKSTRPVLVVRMPRA